MIKVQLLKLSVAGLIIRFYLLMAAVIVGAFTGQWWIALLALPIFISAMLGITFKWGNNTSTNNQNIKVSHKMPAEKTAA